MIILMSDHFHFNRRILQSHFRNSSSSYKWLLVQFYGFRGEINSYVIYALLLLYFGDIEYYLGYVPRCWLSYSILSIKNIRIKLKYFLMFCSLFKKDIASYTY